MLKKLAGAVGVVIAMMLASGAAFAQVDVNKADQVALDGLKGIGPKTSRAILDERKTGGKFKDWEDFEQRVKGVGPASARKLSAAGLTVDGKSKGGAVPATKPADKKVAKANTAALPASAAGKQPGAK